MRVMIVTPRISGGGAERVAVNLANYWASKGWQVSLVTFTPPEPSEYPVAQNISRVSLDPTASSGDKPAGLRLQLSRALRLRKHAKNISPEVVIGIMEAANTITAVAARGLHRLTAIGTVHSFRAIEPLGRSRALVARYIYRWLDAIVVLTNEMRERILQRTHARYVRVIPNSITLPLPDIPPKLPIEQVLPRECKLLLSVGRLEYPKGHDYLLQSFARVAPRHPDWVVVILGEGEWRSHLERLVGAYGLQGVALMPGRAGNLADWYSRADLFVLSSRYEGFPLALAEALAHGVPVVSFDCLTGPRDIVRNNIDGLLVPPEDTKALAEALDLLMRDENLRRRFSERAVEARDRFSMERVGAMWESLFGELMDRKLR